MKIFYFLLSFFIHATAAFSQTDTTLNKKQYSIFEKITGSVKDYKLDTSSVPADKITNKIIELRELKGGFNINEALEFKLEEDKQKGEIPIAEFEKFAAFMKTGNGKKWLDNAVIWIYRQRFTYNELKKLVKFYKTTVGKKMSGDFPIIMMQSLTAAEMIKGIYEKQQVKK